MLYDVMTQGSRLSDKPDDLAHPRASRYRRRPPPLHCVAVAPKAHAATYPCVSFTATWAGRFQMQILA